VYMYHSRYTRARTHREGNVCADKPVNFSLSLFSLDLLLEESILGIGWKCSTLDSPPFEKVLV